MGDKRQPCFNPEVTLKMTETICELEINTQNSELRILFNIIHV